MEPDKFASVSKSVLDIRSLNDVLDACKECAVSWNPVGLCLGLRHSQLEEIAAMKIVPMEKLQRVLDAWLQNDTIPGSLDPSYYILCHAVAKGGANPALAERIAAAHPATAAAASANTKGGRDPALAERIAEAHPVAITSSTDDELSTEPAALIRGGRGEVTASDSALIGATTATLPAQQQHAVNTDGQQSSFDPQLAMKGFRKHYGDLSDLMALPHNRLAIALRLYSEGLITEACLDAAVENNNKTDIERGHDLMAAIRATINREPQTLIKVLKKVEAFQQIADKLETITLSSIHQGAMDSTTPKSFDVLLQSIGVQPSLITSDDQITSIERDTFNCESLKEIVTNPNNTVKVRPVLISFGGLSGSGKTKAFTGFLKHHVKASPLMPLTMKNRNLETDELHHYDLIAAGDPSSGTLHITEATKESSCVFGILSAFKQNLLDKGRVPLLNFIGEQEFFKNPALNEHLQYMYQYLSEFLPTGSLGDDEVIEYAIKLRKLFPDEESALINVWDIPTNKTVHDVLSALQGHLTNNCMWLFLSLERDLDNLHKPPEINKSRDGAVIMKWRPRLHYLLRSCRLSDSAVKRRRNVCTIFARHYVSSDGDLQQRLDELEDIVQSAAEHIGVSNLLNDRIEPISRQNNATSQRLINDIIFRTEVQDVPIAWVFLRTYFHHSSMRFISRDDLKALAVECGMDDNSLTNFCKFYTSFGSIFDLSLVNPKCQYVITKPIHFLKSLDSFLHPPSEICQHYPTTAHGIFPEKVGMEILKEDWPAYLNALVCLNLATEVACASIEIPPDVSLDPDNMNYYIPSGRTGHLMLAIDSNSIHLITNIDTPDIFHQALFTRHLLASLPQSKLVPCTYSNQTIIRDTSTDTTVTLVSYGPATKLHLSKPNGLVCSAVVRAYRVMARYNPVRVKYKFVKMCVEDMIPDDARCLPSALYHVLPDDSLCQKCEDAGLLNDEMLKVWNKALTQHPINDLCRPTEKLEVQEVSDIAHTIASYEKSIDLEVIARTFGFSPDYKSEEVFAGLTGHRLVAEFIDQWNKRNQMQRGGQEPRRALARKLSNLGINLSVKCRTEKEKVMVRGFFERLASEVDLHYIPQGPVAIGAKRRRIDQRYLRAAMKDGSVHSHITKAVVQGEARAGKTSLKCLLLKLPYDQLSTSCIEAPQVAYGSLSVKRFGRTDKLKCWTLVEDKKMTDKVLTELKLTAEEKKGSATMSVDSISTQLQFDQSEHVQNSDTDRDLQLKKENVPVSTSGNNISTAPKQPSSASGPQNNAEPFPMHSAQSDDSIQVPSVDRDEEEAIAKVKELYEKCKDVQGEERLKLHQEWLYFIDSGGQIQFQKLLPAFMPFASVLILVINLVKGLSDPACTVMQLEHDQQISVSEHSLTVEEILKQLLSAIASSTEKFNSSITKDVDSLSKYIKPPSEKLNVIAVATHCDEGSIELLNATEANLKQIFDSMKSKCTIVRGSPFNILYEIDGRKAKSADTHEPVIEQIAEKLYDQAYEIEVPLKWYCFNILLHSIAEEGCGVLSLSYCKALGEQLGIQRKEMTSVLKFLHILNMILYYPDSSVADLVFVQLDSLIDIIRDLVVWVCKARKNLLAADDDFMELANKGLVSVKVLEQSPNYCNIHSFFPDFGNNLLKLFQKLLIAACHSPAEDKYFMPALLPVKDVSNLSPFPKRTPFLFFFKNALPMGLFCAFIVHLLSHSSGYTSDYESSNSSIEDDDGVFTSSRKRWRIVQTKSLNWSNYFTLQYNDMKGQFVFVERLDCIEVHAEHPNVQIRKLIRKAIKATIEERELKERVEKAFYCNCSFGKGVRHVAVLRRVDQKYALRCNISDADDENLDEEKSLWLIKKKQGKPEADASSTEAGREKVSSMNKHIMIPISEQILERARDSIGELKEFPVDSSGLTYHCSQYSLIIPEGAVPAAATVWFGACTFSDKFQFEDGYTPVTPIVWIYIDCVLTKPAQLRLPHHIDVKNMAEPEKQFCLMKAIDEVSSDDNITLKYCKHDIEIESTDHVSISLESFSFLCIGIKNYTEAPKRYVMARIDEKKSGLNFDVHFCFLYDRSDCKEMLKLQYPGIADPEYRPFNLEPGEEIKLLFDTLTVPGWKYFPITLNRYVTEAMIDDPLSMKKEERLYPPRLTLRFELQDISEAQRSHIREISVTIAGVKGRVVSKIDLNVTDESSTEAALPREGKEGESVSVDSSTNEVAISRKRAKGTAAGASIISSEGAMAPLPIITGDQQQPLELTPQVVTEIFKKHLPELSKLMSIATNRLSIAITLYSEGFVTWDAYNSVNDGSKTDQEKGISLTNTLMTSISSQPELLIKLVDVLKQEEPFQLIAEQLSDKIKRATGTTSIFAATAPLTGGGRRVDTSTQLQPVPVTCTSIGPPLTDVDLISCSRHLVDNLEDVAGFLGISDECLESIQAQHKKSKAVQGYKVLKKWQEDHPKGTRQHLIDVFKSLQLTEAVKSLSTGAKHEAV